MAELRVAGTATSRFVLGGKRRAARLADTAHHDTRRRTRMATSRMPFDFSFGPARERRRDAGPVRRMLVVADLGGRRAQPLAERRPLPLDVDNFEQVFARIAPSVSIELDGVPLTIDFELPEDFHPDRLFARLPAFDALRGLRGELRDPAQFRGAAAALGLSAAPAPAQPPAAAALAAADIERLLGRAPSQEAPAEPETATVLKRWLHEQVAPHIVPDTADEQRALLAGADQAIGVLMRRVLHHPAFQAPEAAWLGVDRLVRGLDLGEVLQLSVLDASRIEIEQDLAAHRADLSQSALHRLLSAPAGASPEGRHWTLWVLDQAFGPAAEDVQLLAALGAIGARAGAPLLAGATPQAAGCASLAELAQPRRWAAVDAPELVHWAALRGAPMAPWLGLVLPRVLMRLPYGRDGERVASFEFDEMPLPREHEAYLWGCGSLAAALLAGRALQQEGEEFDVAAEVDLDDLPSHVFSEDSEKHQQPCAELLLPEEAGVALLARGLMPLLSWRDRNAARLLRWQSLAEPTQALQGLCT
jgi:type VI secretion system protein ImpC